MTHTPFKLGLFALAITATLLLTDCNRKNKNNDSDTEVAADNAISESAYNDVLNIANVNKFPNFE